MTLQLRNWKVIAAIAGIVAVAVVTVVLVLGTSATPSDGTVAILNGEQIITKEDVYRMQLKYWWTTGEDMSDALALEAVIMEKLLYREAELGGHIPTIAETEHEWQVWTGSTLEQIKAQLEMEGLDYDERLEDFRTTLAIYRVQDALRATIEITEEEVWELYEELTEAGEQMGPFEEERSVLIDFLEYEKLQDLIREIRNNAVVEYK